MWVPVERSWRLNERHYGALQGSTRPRQRSDTVRTRCSFWRRGYDVRPPALENDDMRNPANDPRYRSSGESDLLPLTESLKDTSARFLPYWEQTIAPAVLSGKRVLVAAHGNVFRALIKAPGRRFGRGDRRRERPHGHTSRIRTGRPIESGPPLLPGRSRGDRKSEKAVADQLKAG